jgi:hypothetical protein
LACTWPFCHWDSRPIEKWIFGIDDTVCLPLPLFYRRVVNAFHFYVLYTIVVDREYAPLVPEWVGIVTRHVVRSDNFLMTPSSSPAAYASLRDIARTLGGPNLAPDPVQVFIATSFPVAGDPNAKEHQRMTVNRLISSASAKIIIQALRFLYALKQAKMRVVDVQSSSSSSSSSKRRRNAADNDNNNNDGAAPAP